MWIESHQELRHHPKTLKLAKMLSISTVQAVGHLHFLWWWAIDYSGDGRLSKFSADDIALAAGWDGESQKFVDALLNCGPGDSAGFLESDEEGIKIHDWSASLGKVIKRVEDGRERAKKSKEKKDATRNLREDYAQPTRNLREDSEKLRADYAIHNNTIQDNTEQDKDLKPSCSKSDISSDVDFEEFYDKYPRKVAKEKARSAWKTRKAKTHFDPKEVIQAARNYSIAMDGLGKGKEYIAHPATWLNQDRWREWKKGGSEYLAAEEAYSRTQSKDGEYSGGHWEEITPEEAEALERESIEWREKRGIAI